MNLFRDVHEYVFQTKMKTELTEENAVSSLCLLIMPQQLRISGLARYLMSRLLSSQRSEWGDRKKKKVKKQNICFGPILL